MSKYNLFGSNFHEINDLSITIARNIDAYRLQNSHLANLKEKKWDTPTQYSK